MIWLKHGSDEDPQIGLLPCFQRLLPLLHSKRKPYFQVLNRQNLASPYQRIGPLKYFDFRGPIVRAKLSTKPLQFSSSCNEQHLKLGKGAPFFVSYFFRDISPQILTPCRLFNCKIGLRIFDHRFYVAETRKYTEIRLVLSLGCLQL